MWRVNQGRTSLSILLVVLIFCLILPSFLLAQEEKKDLRPERGIAIYPEFSGVIVSKGEAVRMDLVLENKGRTDETIDVKISTVPKGWKAQLKGASFLITGMYVPNGKTKNLALNLEPDKTIGIGTYVFSQFDAQTADGKFTSTHKLTVDVQERITGADDIQITTSYPVLRGQTDARFEFSIEVVNKSESDRTLNLAAMGPEKWRSTSNLLMKQSRFPASASRERRAKPWRWKSLLQKMLCLENIPSWSGLVQAIRKLK